MREVERLAVVAAGDQPAMKAGGEHHAQEDALPRERNETDRHLAQGNTW